MIFIIIKINFNIYSKFLINLNMRTFYIILLFLLISYINTDSGKSSDNDESSECREWRLPTSFNECKNLDVAKGEKKCCYLVVKDYTSYCHPATKKQYKDQNNFKIELEALYKSQIIEFKCHSNYLKYYLLALLLILF